MVATWNIAADASYYPREATGGQRESYYTGDREPPGQWYAPKGDFGLVDGSGVDAGVFAKLYAGLAADGTPLIEPSRRRGGNRIPAFDFTFSAPRSISLVWAFSPQSLRTEIEEAFLRASRTALGFLEREATFGRRGRGGAHLEPVSLTAAMFRHGDSRPAPHADGRTFGDPNLHVHCVIPNIATRADGTVGAIHSTAQRDFKMCLGAIQHAALASELQKLGFDIDRSGANGTFEIAGVADDHIAFYSARSNEIKAELKKHNHIGKGAAALAAAIAVATRHAKDTEVADSREQIWKDTAQNLGIETETFSTSLRKADREFDREAAERIFSERLSVLPAALTECQSVISKNDLLRSVAVTLVGTGLPTISVDRGIAQLIETDAVVEIGRDRGGRPLYSTREMIRLEREVATCAARLASRRGFALDPEIVRDRSQSTGLNVEQINAAIAMTGTSAIAVVTGAPGSGKTTTLTPVVAEYRAAGHRVLGAATAWRTATTLGTDLSITSRSIASWLSKARHGGEFLQAGDVLIVDEAALVAPRDMHALLAEVERADAKAVLVGDPKQLQAIGGPGLALVQSAVESTRVETIVRQHDVWQRDAIKNFGSGQAEEALAAYAAKGRLVEADGRTEAIETIVGRWRDARAADPDHEPLLLARTNADIAAISEAVRQVRRTEGSIIGPDITFPAVTPSGQTTTIALARGDKIRFLARNDAIGVINGTIGSVTAVHQPKGEPEANDLSRTRIEAEIGGRRVTFSPADLADRKGRAKLGWAYATTVYQSQGMTVDHALVLVDAGFDRHQIYVAASRAKKTTTLVVDGKAIDRLLTAERPVDEQADGGDSSAAGRRAWLAKRLAQAHVQQTTLDVAQIRHLELEADPRWDRNAPETERRQQRSREASLG